MVFHLTLDIQGRWELHFLISPIYIAVRYIAINCKQINEENLLFINYWDVVLCTVYTWKSVAAIVSYS